ncbi:MAG: signal peptidase I [Candidatus Paceibacteria bacterium]|jgi:signal peptidase I
MATATAEDNDAKKSSNPWRENIEAITMAVVMAVMLKYFIVEAYKIPTGSMQPTLMGNEETDIKDRILVDKFSYHFREPERWEVTVFKYPLDLSKNFIKRMVGVGPEELKIEDGDLFNRPDSDSEWKPLRRPQPIQDEVWKALYPGQGGLGGWKANGGARTWQVEGEEVSARGNGSLRYPASGSIMDDYRDGYPLSIRGAIRPNGQSSRFPVGDLRLSTQIEALPGCERIVIDLREGSRQYHFVLPGPAAKTGEVLRIEAKDTVNSSTTPLATSREIKGDIAWKLEAGSRVEVSVQNMDDLLSLQIDGETVLELEIPSASKQASAIFLHVEGEGADFEELMAYRDIFYTSDHAKQATFVIPDDHYVMLGDNTQDSSDSREWMLRRVRYPRGTGEILRGNDRGLNNENPRIVQGLPGGAVEWFRDEFGELHHYKAADAEPMSPEKLSLVPRELITGRAVVVFWPMKPSFKLWRLTWVH